MWSFFKKIKGFRVFHSDQIFTEIKFKKGEESVGWTTDNPGRLPQQHIGEVIYINETFSGKVSMVEHTINVTGSGISYLLTIHIE